MAFENENYNKANRDLGIAGTVLGAIGTAAAVGLGNGGNGGYGNGGFLGGLFGGGCNKTAIEQEEKISRLQAEVANLASMRYTDQVGIDLYKEIISTSNSNDAKLAALQNKMYDYVIALDRQVALNTQAQELNRAYDTMARDYQMTILNNKIDCCCDKANIKIDTNKRFSDLADASIVSYVNSNFINGSLYLPASSITPTVTLA